MARYEIAGLQIEMEPQGRTQKQAAAYAAPAKGEVDMTICCDPALLLERNPQFRTEDLAEYLGMGTRFAYKLLDHNGLMLHSSAVVLDGKAYLFTAPSGTGKSTHTEKWVRLFGATYLNDDKPALRLVDGVWMAYGTPWSGKHDLSDPRGVPVGGIAVVRRDIENSICRMTPEEALPYLMSQTAYRLKAVRMDKLLTLMDDLLQRVPIWELRCGKEDDAAYVSRDAML